MPGLGPAKWHPRTNRCAALLHYPARRLSPKDPNTQDLARSALCAFPEVVCIQKTVFKESQYEIEKCN